MSGTQTKYPVSSVKEHNETFQTKKLVKIS